MKQEDVFVTTMPEVDEHAKALAERMNTLLSNKTIVSVEQGTTAGWVVIHFADEIVEGKKVHPKLTIWVGGDRQYFLSPHMSDFYHNADIAFHRAVEGAWGSFYPLYRSNDPEASKGWKTQAELDTEL